MKRYFKFRVKSKLTIFILLAYFAIFCGEQLINASQSTKHLFAFIIFNPNLKMLLPSEMMGLLWWHQFDGLGISLISLTMPLQMSVFTSEWNAYFTTSNQFAVEKNKPCPLFSSLNNLFILEVHHNMEIKKIVNFRFTWTLNVKLKSPVSGNKSLISHCNWTESFKRLIHSGTKHCHVVQRRKTVL